MTRGEYNQCVEAHADGLFRFILKQTRNEHNAEDVVQNTFEILWKNHVEVDFKKAKAYLFKVAYHNMIDQIRKSKRMVLVEDLPQNQTGYTEVYSGLKEILEEALSKLPESQRAAILLRDNEGYTYEEIGKVLELNKSQVKVYIFRGRKTLQKYLVSPNKVI